MRIWKVAVNLIVSLVVVVVFSVLNFGLSAPMIALEIAVKGLLLFFILIMVDVVGGSLLDEQ